MIKKIKEMFNSESYSDKKIKEYESILVNYKQEKENLSNKTDEEIKSLINELRDDINTVEDRDENLDKLLGIASVISERILRLDPYDEQIIGAIAIINENIIQMATGEGKTLVGAISAFLNSFIYKRISIATVNDFLAERDASNLKEYYNFLGLTVSSIKNTDNGKIRKEKYSKNVVYATASEYCYDFLRSNLVLHKDEKLFENNRFFLIDEVDSILIDRAKRPIVLTTQDRSKLGFYKESYEVLQELIEDEDYTLDDKDKKIDITYEGIEKIEEYFKIDNLYTDQHISKLNHIKQAIYAKHFLIKDEHYKIENSKLILIDQETKRVAKGKRFNEGFQQSVEMKEGLQLSPSIKVKASISYQNFFKTVKALSGMTATATPEAGEFKEIYELNVIEIPTHEPLIRKDLPDVIYQTKRYKNKVIVDDIIEINKTGQPILMGCKDNKEMAYFSGKLTEAGVPHETLQSKNHATEAKIIKKAGEINSVTLITKMAGRGTDIKVPKESNDIGGLYIIGTTRQGSRRIDYQLRGRTGRQGAPGISKFYLSLEDEMMIKFGGGDVKKALEKLQIAEDHEIKSNFVDNLVNQIQQRCEENNKNVRSYLYKFDNIVGAQRSVIYNERDEILEADFEELREIIIRMFNIATNKIVEVVCSSEDYPEDWSMDRVIKNVNKFTLKKDHMNLEQLPSTKELEEVEVSEIREFKENRIANVINNHFLNILDSTVENIKINYRLDIRRFYKATFLKTIDNIWEQQLDELNELKQGINLRMVGHENPILEYSFTAADMFENLKEQMGLRLTVKVLKIQFIIEDGKEAS